MLQVIQHQKTGALIVEELPPPVLRPGEVLVRNANSVLSAGTERSMVQSAKKSLVARARQKPELVRQLLSNVRKEGIQSTYAKVMRRLNNYQPLGYSSAGIVVESTVNDFHPGDRVACGGTAYHAELVAVPRNLCAKIPTDVSFEHAAFATIGAIALQGVRQADVSIGESVAVVGLGLLGVITVQILKAAGCRVVGVDVNQANFELAKSLGCDESIISDQNAVRRIESFSRGIGSDATIITASTSSNGPLELALACTRKRGKIVVVGSVGMNVPRHPFYEKELELRISTSYGPGRYDENYEEKGVDYPVSYVRWTENRNMTAVLDLMAAEKLKLEPIISHRFPLAKAADAYEMITGKTTHKFLGVLFFYPLTPATTAGSAKKNLVLKGPSGKRATEGRPSIGFIGLGGFADSILIPAFGKSGAILKGACSRDPVKGSSVARKHGFGYFTTDSAAIMEDKSINTVVIATRHDSHPDLVANALKAGKHIFVEKPLAIDEEQLSSVKKAYEAINEREDIVFFTGFNRRFSGQVSDIKNFFSPRSEPLIMMYRVNAGGLSPNHWSLDNRQGGRMLGEGCHFIDTMMYLAGSGIAEINCQSIRSVNPLVHSNDNASVIIEFADGSIGNLIYLTDGDTSVHKELLEVHSAGMSVVMDDFKAISFHRNGRSKKKNYDGRKGHSEEVQSFVGAISGAVSPAMSFNESCDVTEATFKILESTRDGKC